jgi:hypothetical protein
VNGQALSKSDTKLAVRLTPIVGTWLRKGWILMATNPIRMFNVRTRGRIVLSAKHEPAPPALPPDEIAADEEDVPEEDVPEEDVCEAPVRLEEAATQKVEALTKTLAKEADATTVRHPPYSPLKQRKAHGSTRQFHWDRSSVTDPHRGVKTDLFEGRKDMPHMRHPRLVCVKLRDEEEVEVDSPGR